METESLDPKTGQKRKERKKVLRKIPAKVLRNAQGIIIFSAMRNGIAPFGGSGGAGVIMARLEDGSKFFKRSILTVRSVRDSSIFFLCVRLGWSAPSFISPNNLTIGLLLGCDFYDSIMILNSRKAVEAFYPIGKVTIGTEMAVAAGPYGSGASIETGMDRTPVLSYVRSRGLYAGIEILANAFICRFDEVSSVIPSTLKASSTDCSNADRTE